MSRIILTYGLISGVIINLGMIATIIFNRDAPQGNMLLGYLIMLVGLSAILVGIKQYRDQSLGGVIGFRKALVMGLGISLAATVAYVLVWEAYLAMTDYAFMPAYVAQTLEAKRAAGVSGAEYAKIVAEMEAMSRQYANPLFRLPMTSFEILPVGVLVALACAALLRNPRFLPARLKMGA